MKIRYRHIFISALSILLLSACSSTKKNTAATRFYHAFNTRYNVYFNGDENYKEQIKLLEDNYQDDYTEMVLMHPAVAYANPKAPQPSGSFDRTIEKMQKAIQLHSIKKRPLKNSGKMNSPKYREFMKRDEYNPFIHNAWFLMGKAQYMKGDFLGAVATFMYTAKHFTWKPELVTAARLWQARCYLALGWQYESEDIFVKIKKSSLSPNLLKLYDNVYAEFLIHNKNYKEALPYLERAQKSAGRRSQRTRLQFLLGQLYAETGNKAKAYTAFKKVSGTVSTYRTQFNARIKQSEVFSGKDITSEVKSLKRMTSQDRNKEYLDQIYYAIGNLYISRNDTIHAIENYKLATEKSTRNGIDKAVNQVTLGNLYFAMRKYVDAQPCYSEAVPKLPETYDNYQLLKRRSDVLDELAVFAQNVELQDSLLRLAAMSEDQRMAVINKIIEALKKKEKEEANQRKQEEYMAKQAGNAQTTTNTKAPTTYTMNTDNSWYFYNTATVSAGKTDFQKRWGSRKLEDNWRRRDKSDFSMSDFEENSENAENTEKTDNAGGEDSKDNGNDKGEAKEKGDKGEKSKDNDPHYPEYYLKQIPSTEEEIANAHSIIQEGRYNMAVILKDKLEDFGAAIAQFNLLITAYPDTKYLMDSYYNMYLIYMRINDKVTAERYRTLLRNAFPESKYAIALKDPEYLDKLRHAAELEDSLYQQTYNAYLENKNATVHSYYKMMQEEHATAKTMPKFMLLNSLSYVSENNIDKFKDGLKELLEKYPETDITPLASSILKQIAVGRKLNSAGSSNMRGMIWNTRLSNDSVAKELSDSVAPFTINRKSPHLLVLVFPSDTVSSNQLLFDMAKHNFTYFVVRDFELEQMRFNNVGMIVVHGFQNYDELTHYRGVMKDDKNLVLPPQVRPVMISESNFKLLLNDGRTFEEYFNFIEENSMTEEGKLRTPAPAKK